MDYINGIKYDPIKSELKSYRAEHLFQKSSGRKTEFASDEDIIVHVHTVSLSETVPLCYN